MPSAALPSDLPASHDLLQALLAMSLPGIILFRPVFAPDQPDTLTDLAYVHLNPAAQQMLGLPAQPTETFLTLYPNARETGIFGFYRDTYLSEQPGDYAVDYAYDGLDNFFLLSARRSGELLVVGFTDTAARERSAVEQALRESQAREQAARAEAEAQRQRFYDVLLQLPAQVATYHGPDHVFSFVNQRFGAFVPAADLLGCPVREAARGAVGEEVFARLDQVYATGEPLHLPELEVVLAPHAGAAAAPLFVSAFYLPLRDAAGRIHGVLDFSYDVTEQVLARRQVQQLNQELEARVQARTAQLRQQENHLQQILGQVPAAIATLIGPDHRFAFFNDAYQALSGGRARAGQSVAELLPEVVAQGFTELLDAVYATGQPHVGAETAIDLHDPTTGGRVLRYLDFLYQPLTDEHEHSVGVLAFAVDVTERVRARQQAETLHAQLLATAQRRAHEREAYYQVFEQTPALVALLRAPGHRFEYVNPAYQSLFPGRQLVGLDLAVAAPETVEQGFVALLDRVYQTGETYFGNELPFTRTPAAGQPAGPVYFNFTYQAYREAGAVAGISIFAYDVTEQVEARQQREAEQQRRLNLFQQAPAGIGILAGPDLVFEFVNPRYQALLPGRALLGRALLDALPELAGGPLVGLLRAVYATGEPHEEQALLIPVAPAGGGALEDRYFTFICQPRRDERAAVDGVLVFAFEVSQQVRAQQRAERSESRFRHLAETTPLVVWEADAAGHTTYLSPQWERFTAAANGQGLGWQDYLHPDDQVPFVQAWRAAVAGGRPFQAEMRLRVAATGEYRWHLDRAVPVRDAAGTLVQWVGAAIDIHEQKLAEQQLQQLTQQLRAARDEAHALNAELTATNAQLTRTNVDLDSFIYVASHDLRAPITNIEGLLAALQEQLPEAARQAEQVPYLFGLLHGAVERFQLTLEQLTDLTKLQQVPQAPAETIDLAALIDDVRLDLAPLLTATGAQVGVAVSACPRLRFAPQHLRSIVYNLLSNAVKYHHPDRPPHVQVRCHPAPGGGAVLEVQDNGLGLSEAQQARLFGLFQRLHTHVEGSGIGLYMVKRLVENAGGSIAVLSQPGVGTTFRVGLPA